MKLHPRLRIDIEPRELLRALSDCAAPPDERVLEDRLGAAMTAPGRWLATLSVRSAFDLFLGALALPRGSEVVMSGLTVPDMWRLVRLHGLEPVAVDLPSDTLAPEEHELERALTPKTRLIVVAHLLGARCDLEPTLRVAKKHQLLVVEDLAQAFTGPATTGSPESALWLFSFGSIKTATALGGALAWVQDPALAAQMERMHAEWPRQTSTSYAKKVSTFVGLSSVRGPHRFRAFERACALTATELDAVLRKATRGFPSDEQAFLTAMRRRPSAALLALLARRLGSFDERRVRARAEAGEWLLARVGGVGGRARARTHWLYAIERDRPDEVIAALRRDGFDAARGTTTINVLPGGRTPRLDRLLERIIFVPAYPEIPRADLEQLARALDRHRQPLER